MDGEIHEAEEEGTVHVDDENCDRFDSDQSAIEDFCRSVDDGLHRFDIHLIHSVGHIMRKRHHDCISKSQFSR